MNYWAKRFEQLNSEHFDAGAEAYNKIQEQYRRATAEIEKELAKWYTRYATENGISLAEAQKRLNGRELEEFRMSVKEYIEKGRTLNYSDEWAKQLEAASARVHVSRLEAIRVQLQQQAEALSSYTNDTIDSLARNIYTEGYYHTVFELQKGIGVGWDFTKLDKRKIDKVINTPWAPDGSNFSDRVWKNKAQLMEELNSTFTRGVMIGKAPDKVIKEMTERLQVSRGRVSRLVMTESAYFSSASTKDAFNDLGVEQYEITATLDTRTSETCRDLDGKVFDMKDFKPGVTAPPFHVYCRSTTVPYFDDEFTVGEGRAARNEDGEYYIVPSNMNYREWEKTFLDGGSKEGLEVFKAEHEPGWRKKFMKKQEDTPKVAINKEGNKIIFDEKMEAERWKEARKIITDLSNEYDTSLIKVRAKTAEDGMYGGTVDIDGTMMLSSRRPTTVIHEFAHSLANTSTTKLGLTNDTEFWKEIRKIRTAYKKEMRINPLKRVSWYAEEDIDEFMAECFTQVKAKEMGFDISEEFGNDFTYSKKVLEVIDKYFKKGSTKGASVLKVATKNGTINKGAISGALNPQSKEALKHANTFYAEVRKRTTDYKIIAKRTGFSEDYVKEVKEHLFLKKHDLGQGELEYFYPDYEIAQSWQRLTDSNMEIQSHDLILLQHEHLEAEYMKQGLTQKEAHEKTDLIYNYGKALKERS